MTKQEKILKAEIQDIKEYLNKMSLEGGADRMNLISLEGKVRTLQDLIYEQRHIAEKRYLWLSLSILIVSLANLIGSLL